MTHKEMREKIWIEIRKKYLNENKTLISFRLPDLGEPERNLMKQSLKYLESKDLIKCAFSTEMCSITLKDLGIESIETIMYP